MRSAEAAAEQHDFHDHAPRRIDDVHLGIGTMKRPPHSPTWRICATISSFRFQGRMRT